MGLDPKRLDSLPEALVTLYSQVEETILQDMARKLSAYDYFVPAAQHQMQKLEELGAVREDIISRLSAITGKSRKEIADMVSEAGKQVVRDDVEYYTAADVYKPTQAGKEAVYSALNSGLKQTEQSFVNITRTTANAATRQFERALDTAWAQISTGTMDYNSAIRGAVKVLAAQGLQSVTYKSGRTDTLEVAVRRAAITGVNQAAMRTSAALANELGLDLVEVSAHSGARPEHARWQGKCYSLHGRQEIDGVVYEDLRKATGYGTGAGLGGWNCRHSFSPYVHGAPRTYTPEMLERYNARNIEYNGKKYTEYEASQIQRGLERNIRRWKRENSAMTAAGLDATDSAVRLRSTQAGLRDFLKQTGLKRQSDREQIAGFGRSQAARAIGDYKKALNTANSIFSLGSDEANLKAYLKDKSVIDTLQVQGIKYKQRISSEEIVVYAGKPRITSLTSHALKNLQNKPDRINMTLETAQSFVDNAKLTLYQQNNETLKFLAQDGYAVVSFDNSLVTSVPQKWRKKYDEYLEDT